MNYELLEVRCCCQPIKLLGWMRCPEGTSHRATRVTFQKARRFALGRMPVDPTTPVVLNDPQAFSLPIEFIIIGARRYKAVKAEGMSLNELLDIPEFTPSTEAQATSEHST